MTTRQESRRARNVAENDHQMNFGKRASKGHARHRWVNCFKRSFVYCTVSKQASVGSFLAFRRQSQRAKQSSNEANNDEANNEANNPSRINASRRLTATESRNRFILVWLSSFPRGSTRFGFSSSANRVLISWG